jgi:hypothetical protein
MRKMTMIALGVAAVVLVAVQFVPLEFPRDNPPATAPIQAPDEVTSILRGSCFDCHSHETEWPWYAWVAPASWLVTADVAEARTKLNFSEWESLSDRGKRRRANEIVEQVEEGEMPMWQYLITHPGARLGEEEIGVLIRWRDGLGQ